MAEGYIQNQPVEPATMQGTAKEEIQQDDSMKQGTEQENGQRGEHKANTKVAVNINTTYRRRQR